MWNLLRTYSKSDRGHQGHDREDLTDLHFYGVTGRNSMLIRYKDVLQGIGEGVGKRVSDKFHRDPNVLD